MDPIDWPSENKAARVRRVSAERLGWRLHRCAHINLAVSVVVRHILHDARHVEAQPVDDSLELRDTAQDVQRHEFRLGRVALVQTFYCRV